MLKGSIEQKSIFYQFFILFFIIASSSLVCLSLGVYIAQLNFETDQLNPFSKEGVQALKLIQIFSAIGLFIIPSLCIRHLIGKDKLFVLTPPPRVKNIFLALCLIIIVAPLINKLIALGEGLVLPDFFLQLEHQIQEQMQAFLLMKNGTVFLANLFVMALIPAIGEELLFRGVIQKLLYSFNVHFAIWVSAFLFATLHQQITTLFPIMLMGAIFGYLYYWTKNIWIPIFIHLINNTLSLTLEYLVQQNKLKETVLNFGATTDNLLWVFISLAGTIGILFLIRKNN